MHSEVDSFCLIIHIYSSYSLISPFYIFLSVLLATFIFATVFVMLMEHVMLF